MHSLSGFRDRSRWVWLFLGGLGALAVAAVLGYRPAKQMLLARRSQEALREAQAAIEARQLQTTLSKLRAAMILAPNDPGVLRLTARFLSLNGQAGAMRYWDQLLASGQASMADRQAQVRFAQQLGRPDLAQARLDELARLDPDGAVTQELQLQQIAATGNWPAVISGARQSLQKHPDHPGLRLVLARSLAGSPQAEDNLEALKELRALTQLEGEIAREATRLLIAQAGVPVEELRQLATRLDSEWGSLADRLTAHSVRWELEPDARTGIVVSVRQLFTAESSDEDKVAILQWLRRHDAAEEAANLVSKSVALKSEPLFLARFELLLDRRDWAEADAWLADAKDRLPADALACAGALLAHGQERTADVARHLQIALQAAATRYPRVNFIANLAQRLEQPEVAMQAWARLLPDERYGIIAAHSIVAHLPAHPNPELERLAYRRLAQMMPAEAEAEAQHAYLQLLDQENIGDAESTFQRLFLKYPESRQLAVALALAAFRKGNFTQALTLVESSGLDWQKQEPHIQAIYAAVLAANQEGREARRLLETIPLQRLRPQERKLLLPLLEGR